MFQFGKPPIASSHRSLKFKLLIIHQFIMNFDTFPMLNCLNIPYHVIEWSHNMIWCCRNNSNDQGKWDNMPHRCLVIRNISFGSAYTISLIGYFILRPHCSSEKHRPNDFRQAYNTVPFLASWQDVCRYIIQYLFFNRPFYFISTSLFC